MTSRRLTILRIKDLNGYRDRHPEVAREPADPPHRDCRRHSCVSPLIKNLNKGRVP